MKLIKIAGAALNQTPLDWTGNTDRIRRAIAEARAENVSILCLPELCITGYGCEDAFYAPGVQQKALKILSELLPETTGMLVNFGLPIAFRNRIFNASALAVDGKLLGFTAKRFLAGNGIHYEPRWFTPWPEDTSAEITLNFPTGQTTVPIGDIFYEVGGLKIGFEICEDAWVANRPGRRLYRNGADIILNPSASHFAFDKLETRKRFVLEGSRAFGTVYVYANLIGNEAGRAIYDGGTLIASSGRMLAIGPRLAFKDVILTAAVADIEEARMAQAQASTVFNIPELEEKFVRAPFVFPDINPEPVLAEDKAWENAENLQDEEFARALALGLFDYLRKSRSRGFTVSLSGGADSAAVAACCFLAVKFGVKNLGLEKFKEKLAYIPGISACQNENEICNLLIITAYQPSENSSETTRRAAEEVAKSVNSRHFELNIGEIVGAYTGIVEKALGRKLSWETDDIALQNIQARVRSPSIWMLTNITGTLLLSTSNRSEAAVGYATMDGDTSGGLSPIAGIDKDFLRKWLRRLETAGIDGGFTIPALRFINEQQPTAELRPSESGQTDEDDLMPYEVLDAVEEAAIRDKKMPTECYRLLKMRFPDYPAGRLKEWTAKFFRLWCRNQWKRERYAPSFHLDDKNLDPKTWCRFPILSGGFVQELEELERFAD